MIYFILTLVVIFLLIPCVGWTPGMYMTYKESMKKGLYITSSMLFWVALISFTFWVTIDG